MYIKPKDMFNLIEVAQDALGAVDKDKRVPTEEEVILIRDALIEANKMRIALERISIIPNSSHVARDVHEKSRKALELIKY